jgi:hypothetical protein
MGAAGQGVTKNHIKGGRINEAFLRQQLENGVDEIEFIGDDISALLGEYIDNPNPPYRVKEIVIVG